MPLQSTRHALADGHARPVKIGRARDELPFAGTGDGALHLSTQEALEFVIKLSVVVAPTPGSVQIVSKFAVTSAVVDREKPAHAHDKTRCSLEGSQQPVLPKVVNIAKVLVLHALVAVFISIRTDSAREELAHGACALAAQ